MDKCTLQFHLPRYYSLYVTCHTHGWTNLEPFEWDKPKQRLNFASLIQGKAVDVSIRQTRRNVVASVYSDSKLSRQAKRAIRKAIARTLDLNRETDQLLEVAQATDSGLASLVKQGAGRLLRAPTQWEDVAKTLFTTNCSWALTKKIAAAACSSKFTPAAPSSRHPFFVPAVVASYGEDQLRTLMPIGYRSGYLISLARAFGKGGEFEDVEFSSLGYEKAHELVDRLDGFGPYATNHVMVLSGFFHQIPVDTVIINHIKKTYRVRNIGRFIDRKYGDWGEYMWWGIKLEKMRNRVNWLGD